jgi:hypothetical protein
MVLFCACGGHATDLLLRSYETNGGIAALKAANAKIQPLYNLAMLLLLLLQLALCEHHDMPPPPAAYSKALLPQGCLVTVVLLAITPCRCQWLQE